jgi:hypothetical protein
MDSSPQRHPLKIGLLVDSVVASHYVHDFVAWASANSNVSVTHLIVHGGSEWNGKSSGPAAELRRRLKKLWFAARRRGLLFVLSELLFHQITAIEHRLLARNVRYKRFLHEYDLSSLVANVVQIEPIVSTSGFVYRFCREDVERVKALDLDVLIRCGSRILRGDILTAARFGVLSFHHADNRINRGGPAGFWEVYFRQDTTGFVLQRLTEDLDAGDVLMRGHLGTRHYYSLNKAFLFEKSNHYLKALVEKIALKRELPEVLPKYPYGYILYRNPRVRESVIYVARLLLAAFQKRLLKLLGIANRWNVAFVCRHWRNAEYFRRIELTNLAFRYLADPFLIERGGQHYCFMEELDGRTNRGSIVVYEVGREGAARKGVALQESFHLSFPYLFEYNGELYMCPECSESRSIRIYKCIEFPLRWELATIAMQDVSAADTMIFRKDDRWWMLTNIDPSNLGDHCSELFIFSAASPLSTDWLPHPNNPVIVDASRARNAGILRDGETYFRCSQEQGFDLYGKRLRINEIVTLSETDFVERCVSVVDPSFGPGILATHHLHGIDSITAFDFLTRSRISSGAKEKV